MDCNGLQWNGLEWNGMRWNAIDGGCLSFRSQNARAREITRARAHDGELDGGRGDREHEADRETWGEDRHAGYEREEGSRKEEVADTPSSELWLCDTSMSGAHR